MKLIIVRHAEAEHNVGSYTGIDGHSQLTDKGKEQAKRLAERLSGEHIDAAFTSDFVRARDTAQSIIQFHPQIKLQSSELLRERNMGELVGASREAYAAAVTAAGVKWFEYIPRGGESMLETQSRAERFIKEIVPIYRTKTVLLVSHMGWNRALLAYLLDHDYENSPPIRMLNSAISIVEIRDDGPNIAHVMNDAGHLDEQTAPIIQS